MSLLLLLTTRATQVTRLHSTSSVKRKSSTSSHTTNTLVRDSKSYSRENLVTLPTTTNDLATGFSLADYTTVSADDGTYVNLTGLNNLVYLFKYQHTNSTDAVTLFWNGKTTVAPSTKPVYLQIYNHTTSAYETVATNDTASANVDFILTATKNASLASYYNNNTITARVYQ